MGSGLKGICPRRTNGPNRLKAGKVIESNIPRISDWRLYVQFGPVIKFQMLWYHLAGLSPLVQVMSRKRYEIFHSSSTLRNDQ